MRTTTFYIYIAVLNFCWVVSLLISLAGGHSFSLKNPNNLTLIGIILVCVLNTVLLLFYRNSRKLLYKVLTFVFLACTLGGCSYVGYNLLSLGKETYVMNSPFYLLLIFIAFYTVKLILSTFTTTKAAQ